MLAVYAADVSRLDLDREYPLSGYRLEKLKKQKLLSAGKLGVGAELLLIKALETAAPELSPPLPIVCGEGGKPALSGGGLYFNLSHSGVYAACAVSDCPVGLDIQSEREHKERLAERFFSAQERIFIAGSGNRDYAFTQIWSMKESCVKLLATGLQTPLSSFTVDTEKGRTEIDGRRLFFHHCLLHGCHLSVCSENEADIRSVHVHLIKLQP